MLGDSSVQAAAILPRTKEVVGRLDEPVRRLRSWLEDRYLSDEGYPEFVPPSDHELQTIVSELLRCETN